MALVTFGGIVSEARGKLGSVVYSRNRYSAYARNKTIPHNAKTPPQVTVRANFSTVAKTWSGTLTAPQRTAWNEYADLIHASNVLGQRKHYTGFAAFCQAYMFNLAEGNIVIPSTPAFPTATQPTSFAITAASVAAATLTVTWTPTPPVPIVMRAWCAGILPIGHTWVKNRLRLFIVLAANASPANLYAAYVARFGAPVAGESSALTLSLRDRTSGQNSVARLKYFTWTA